MPLLSAIRKVPIAAEFAYLLALCCCLVGVASAQSTDITTPSAVRANEVRGTIAARDIGDSRSTDHFYAFTGTPGDLLITIESSNLNGDVDVFTATGLRPLLKLTVYAGSSSPVTKGIYLRKRENLILRIEGRTPNDDEATYRLYFGGAFEPITSEPLIAENEPTGTEPATTGTSSGKKTRRVSSVGARIDEPAPTEVTAAPTPEPSPVESSSPVATASEAPKTETPRPEGAKGEVRRAPARTVRGRRPPTRRTPTPAPPKEEPAKSDAPNTAVSENTETEAKPVTKRRGKSTTARAAARQAPAPVEPEPESGPRLVIETDDGTLIDRFMSGVRRVVVENGMVVVAGKDGKIQRIPLASVVKMSIAP